jgi:hypothetical protein
MRKTVLNSNLSPEVCISGEVGTQSENFRVVSRGYIRVVMDEYNVVAIDDWEMDEEQFYFREDKVFKNPLLERFTKEGYVDLKKELEKISNTYLYDLQYEHVERLKSIFNVSEIYFHSKFTSEEKVLIDMTKIISGDFEEQTYNRRKDVCNSRFGFNFTGENLDKELVSLAEFRSRLTLLKTATYVNNIAPLLTLIKAVENKKQ